MTLCVHDRFDDEPGSLIDLCATLKSPATLLDAFVSAVTRTMKPLSYRDLMLKYDDCLKRVKVDAQVAQVRGKHLS